MRLQLSTWPEVEAYLARSTAVIIPIGSTEQHGPSGLIGTDALTAEAIAIAAGERLEALVAPTISVGMAVHHMAFPGSMTLKPSTLVAVIRDSVLGLAGHGFDRFLFVNGHGGNVASIGAAFYEIHAEAAGSGGGTGLRCQLANWYDGETVSAMHVEMFGDDEGSHATPGEIAVTQHLFPDHIKTAKLSPQRAPAGGFHGPEDFRRRYPDGRIGSNPALATPEKGARLLAAAVDGVVKAYEALLAEA